MYVYHDKYDRRAQNNSINFGPTELSYIGEKRKLQKEEIGKSLVKLLNNIFLLV